MEQILSALRSRIESLQLRIAESEAAKRSLNEQLAHCNNKLHEASVALRELQALLAQVDDESAVAMPGNDATGRPSVAKQVRKVLNTQFPQGATLAEIAEQMPNVKRTAISAALFNSKRHNRVSYDESTKKYKMRKKLKASAQPLTRALSVEGNEPSQDSGE